MDNPEVSLAEKMFGNEKEDTAIEKNQDTPLKVNDKPKLNKFTHRSTMASRNIAQTPKVSASYKEKATNPNAAAGTKKPT